MVVPGNDLFAVVRERATHSKEKINSFTKFPKKFSGLLCFLIKINACPRTSLSSNPDSFEVLTSNLFLFSQDCKGFLLFFFQEHLDY